MVIFVALLLGHVVFWSRKLKIHRYAHQVHFVRTQEKHPLAIHRYVPPVRRYKEPIVLCHGLAANRIIFDFAPDRSLARSLAEAGFDVWSLDLRAHGMSHRPGFFSREWRYNFDDYVKSDVPSIVDYVCDQCACEKVFWIGHSLGGMLGCAYAKLSGGTKLAGLIGVAAPVHLDHAKVHRILRGLTWLPVVPFSFVGGLLAPLAGKIPGWIWRRLFFSKNIDKENRKRLIANLVEDTSSKLVKQVMDWAQQGTCCFMDGEIDYFENLNKTHLPILFLAAEKDQLAPVLRIQSAYTKTGSKDKQLRVFGIDSGDDHDYGHLDLLLGDHAQDEVYPEILEWLEHRASPVE
jgi:pimeloyl-ACP methyl ester carboxylesterase